MPPRRSSRGKTDVQLDEEIKKAELQQQQNKKRKSLTKRAPQEQTEQLDNTHDCGKQGDKVVKDQISTVQDEPTQNTSQSAQQEVQKEEQVLDRLKEGQHLEGDKHLKTNMQQDKVGELPSGNNIDTQAEKPVSDINTLEQQQNNFSTQVEENGDKENKRKLEGNIDIQPKKFSKYEAPIEEQKVVNIEQITELREELQSWIRQQQCAPIIVRLAWHDSGTYDKNSSKPWPQHGGADGSIRLKPEIDHAANAGISDMISKLKAFHEKYPDVSYADLYQLSAAIAIEVSKGPHIPIKFGRIDCESGDMCPEEGNLPSGQPPFPKSESAAQHLRDVFYKMGLNDQEIVVLSGAHTLGRAFKHRSGATDREKTSYTENGTGSTVGGQSWTPNWLEFDNSYFKHLIKPEDPELLIMATDKALLEDPAFKEYVSKYADSQDAFFQDYVPAQVKLSELGSKWLNNKAVEIQF